MKPIWQFSNISVLSNKAAKEINPIKNTHFCRGDQRIQQQSNAASMWRSTDALLPPGCCNDLVFARHVSEGAVLRGEVHAVGSSGAAQGEILQKGDDEEEYLHASEGLSDTSSLPWEEEEEKHPWCQSGTS